MERNYYVYFNRGFDEIKSTIRNNSKSKHNIHATNEDFSEFSRHDIANVYRDINFSALAYINGVFVDRGDSCLGGFAGNAVIAKSILLLVDKEAK